MTDVFFKKKTRLLLNVILAGLYLYICVSIFFFNKEAAAFHVRKQQFYFLTFFLYCLNFILIFSSAYAVHTIVLSAKVLIFLLIGLPLGTDIWIKTLVMTVLFIEFLLLSFPKLGLCFSLGLLCLSFVSSGPVMAWGVVQSFPSVIDRYRLFIFGTVVFVLVQAMQYQWRKNLLLKQEKKQLLQMIDQIAEANIGFQKYALSIGNTSILEERNRLSREIHDTIGYTLTNLIIILEACQDLMKKDKIALQKMLLQAGQIAQEGLNDTRMALRALREAGVEQLCGIQAVQKLVNTFQNSTGIVVKIEYGNVSHILPGEIDNMIFRFIQEGLTNAFRHGKATYINIDFWQDSKKLSVVLRDNGTGSVNFKEGIGISGMRERANKLGGELYVQTTSCGFKLSVTLPQESCMEV